MEAVGDLDGIGDIADEQAGHTPHVAGMIYGWESTKFAGSMTARRLQFQASSMDWHQFLGFPDATHPAVDHQEQRRQQLAAMNMEQALQQMTGRPEMTFQGVQGPAMKAIQDGASLVVAIMPTGSGKSMLFMLPAYAAPGGCTIVVGLGIPCVSWESCQPPNKAAIMLVTPESIENPNFHTFLNRQRLLRRLDWIIIDECHVILNPQKDFRPAMARLGRLASAQTQMFICWIQHQPHEVGIYRAQTSRPNVAYQVFWPRLPRGVPQEPH
ncbi:hypothetical protein BDW68DRAFT_193068 [Aspergillus falconensis]